MIKRDAKGRWAKGITIKEFAPGWKGADYRYLMEKRLGRKLLPGEVVHHIDGNRKNNKLENLALFPNNAEHIKYHLQKYKEVDFLSKPLTLNEIVCKRDKGWQSRKFQTRKCIKCGDLFWAGYYGKRNFCGKKHYKKQEKKIFKICKYCHKEFKTFKINSLFCNCGCYWKHKKENFYPGGFQKNHKPYNYWLGKKRSEETKQKISQTKKEKNRDGYNK